MTGYLGKTTNAPREVVGAQAQAERESQWGEIPGRIVSYDPATQTAKIQPLYKPKFNGQPVDMPVLEEVPVRFQRSGGMAITSPIKPGDNVTLRPQMRSMDNYHTDGDGSASDARSFHLTDMEAHLAGGESLKDPLQNFDNENLHLRATQDGSKGIKMSGAGKVKIDGAGGDLMDILATFMELVAGDQLQINYGSSAGTGHQLQNKTELLALAAKVRGMGMT